MNQARLAEWLEIAPISLTRLLDRMESYGWIERIANDDDRRAFVIRLTDKSREIFPQMLEVGDTVADDGLRGFTPDERDTLVRLLGRVRHNLIDCGGVRWPAVRAGWMNDEKHRAAAREHAALSSPLRGCRCPAWPSSGWHTRRYARHVRRSACVGIDVGSVEPTLAVTALASPCAQRASAASVYAAR